MSTHVRSYIWLYNVSFLFQGHPKRLHDFSYKDTDINDVVLSCTANVSMTGVGGRLEFQEGTGDPIKDVKIERIEGEIVTVS